MTVVESSHFEYTYGNSAELADPEQDAEADAQLEYFHDQLVWHSLNTRSDFIKGIGAFDDDPITKEALLQERAQALVDGINSGEIPIRKEELRPAVPFAGRTALRLVHS